MISKTISRLFMMVMLMILFLPGLIPVSSCKITRLCSCQGWYSYGFTATYSMAFLFLPPFPPVYLHHPIEFAVMWSWCSTINHYSL